MEIALIIAVLLIIYLVLLYRRSIKTDRALRNLIVIILLDEQAYQKQKRGMRDLVASIEAKDAIDLSTRVFSSVGQFANQIAESGSSLASHAMLWQVKKRQASEA
jgi:hypothetical protein